MGYERYDRVNLNVHSVSEQLRSSEPLAPLPRTAAASDERFGTARGPLGARSTRAHAELLIDFEEDRTLRAGVVGAA